MGFRRPEAVERRHDAAVSRQARVLCAFRTVHRTTGAALFLAFFVVSCTGLLLGWKKNSGGLLLPKSYKGTSTDLKDWLPVATLHEKACRVARERTAPDLSLEMERIDIRPDKGMVKFVFAEGFWGIQLDGATGDVLHIERRNSDFIENIHDGSVLDYVFRTDGGQFKLVYSTVTGGALLMFTITGFWLWLGPKRMRAQKRRAAALSGASMTPE